LDRLRDLVLIAALEDEATAILRNYPADQLERMRGQAARIGGASLNRAAAIVAEGLNQMRGTTPPRLTLEMTLSRVIIAGNDKSELGLLTRVERLERASQLEPMPTPTPAAAPAKKAEPKSKPEPKAAPASGNIDVTALRRMWPDVIENVKKRRRLTWSLLSASAQILSVDEQHITIGIINAGARDSFIRSESEPILADAFVEVTGLKRKIEVIVDPSVDPNSAAKLTTRTVEDPSDETQINGTELIMKELGAQVIAEER